MPKKNAHEATLRSVEELLTRLEALLSRIDIVIAKSEETRGEVLEPIARLQVRPSREKPGARADASRALPHDAKLAPRAVAKRVRRAPAR